MLLFHSSSWWSDSSVLYMGNNGQHVPQRLCSPHVAIPGFPKNSFTDWVTPLPITPRCSWPQTGQVLLSHHHPAWSQDQAPYVCQSLQSRSIWTCGMTVVQLSLQRLIWSCFWQSTSAWGTHNGPAALYPAAALIPLPQERKRGTDSRRERGDSACDGTQRKTDHSELFELEIREVILYSSTRERILHLVYTIC